ncbi:hypothetical protein BXO88_03570 [Oribacterium sp. C9]|uniref:hypothetical protein n=1 Tax=Oribacterium sp. C9 TaxID=1943579 RepID=UPI0009CF4415|nr:hypothetical protein [Oribacterium sp. C9]OON87365.1 hypothetical protein BXO88_03570 [Oribacterium sp. C9]
MSAAVKKLKSNSGATLMMALLFFAICAVTGSMILLSATATAGRLSVMRDTDQNYYAVRSATKFVEKQLNKKEYIEAEEKVRKHVEMVPITDPVTGNVSYKTKTTYIYTPPVFYKVEVDDSGQKNTSSALPEISSPNSGMILYMLMNENISNYDKKKKYNDSHEDKKYPYVFYDPWFKGSENEKIEYYPLPRNITISENTEGELSVNMDAKMDSTGVLTLKFINSEDGEKKDNKYSIELKMQCNEEPKYSKESEAGDLVEKKTYIFTFETKSLEKR